MKKFLVTAILISLYLISFSQRQQIEFINANRFFTTAELGPSVKVFVGEVVLQHDSATMYCDSALYNTNLNTVDAFGNIEIQRLYNWDTIFLYGDTLHYDGTTKMAKVRNRVILEQDTTVLTTNFLDYDLEKKYGKYSNGGRIISGSDTINSVFGYYYSDTKNVFFKKDVVVRSKKAKILTDTIKHDLNWRISYLLGPSEIFSDSNYIYAEYGRYDHNENRAYLSHRSMVISGEHSIMADSLFYNRALGFGKGYGNVIITDTIQNLILKGNYGEYYEDMQRSMMTDSALFMEIEDNDTLWLHADTLMTFVDTLFDDVDTIPFRVLFAYNHVKMYKEDLQLKSDSLVYSQLDSVLMLFGDPYLWSNNQQLNAQYIELYMTKNEAKEMFMYDSTYISEMIDSSQFNIIKADFLQAWFKDRTVDKVQQIGNIDALYYMQDDSDSSIIGIGLLHCDSMNIFLDEGQIQLLVPYIQPSGKIYPPDQLPETQRTITGFKWADKNRPKTKEEIFIWFEDNVADKRKPNTDKPNTDNQDNTDGTSTNDDDTNYEKEPE